MGYTLIQGENVEEVKAKFKEKYPNEEMRSCSLVEGKKTLYSIIY